MKSFLYRVLYNMIGKLILLPIIYISIRKGADNLPSKFFYFDNDEDGYTGDKRGWYSKYLKVKVSSLPLWKQTLHAYRWSAWRNPSWNLRFHPDASIDVGDAVITHEGNTRVHDYQEGHHGYNCVINGEYEAHFRLIPLTKTKSLYLRWGWKIYPHLYVNGRTVPKHKKRSIWAFTIRIRGKS